MDTKQLLTSIEKKAKRLKQHNERLLADNAALEARLFDYLQQLEQTRSEVKRMEETLKHRAVGELVNNKQDLRKELDRYIKIIDQCLATINTRE